MKRAKIVLFFCTVLTNMAAYSQTTASFNFSAGSQPVAGWINVAGDPALSPHSATDPATGISISSVAVANWSPFISSAPSCAFDGGGEPGGSFFPAAVMLNHWFQYNSVFGAYNPAVPQLEITGLNINSVYTLKMTGSFSEAIPASFELNPMNYTVAGATVYGNIAVNGDFNTANGAVFNNIAPDASGMIKVYVNTTATSNVASISGIQIIQGRTAAPTPAISITTPSNNDVFPEDGNITFSVNASETNGSIARVEFYADTTKIGVDSTAPYGMTWFSPVPGNYSLTARAVDGLGNINTTAVNIRIQALSGFWNISGNTGLRGDSNFVGNVDSVRLAFRTNNVERVSISPVGNVGIGVDTPTAQLHTTGTVRLAHYKNDTSGTSVLTTDTSGNLKLIPQQFAQGLIRSGDTIGLGGTVDVKGLKGGDFLLNFVDSRNPGSSGGLSYLGNLLSEFSFGSGFLDPGKFGQGAGLTTSTTANPYNPGAPTGYAFQLQDFAWLFTQRGILSNQAAVFGKAADSGTGSQLYLLSQDQAGLSSINMLSQNIAITSPGIQFVNFLNNASGDSVLTTDANGHLRLRSLSSFNSSGRWQLSGTTAFDSLDNIGIGTSNTQGYKLAVNGNVIVGRITVKAFGTWPDYIFDPSYKLLSLPELERYISRNKHLPDVATEEEVEKGGQDIGKEQAELLKKVEELTLYMIELNKKVDNLKMENERLKKKIHPVIRNKRK